MILEFKIVAIMLYLTSICSNFMYFWPSYTAYELPPCQSLIKIVEYRYIYCVLELHSFLKSTFVHDANNTWQLVLI